MPEAIDAARARPQRHKAAVPVEESKPQPSNPRPSDADQLLAADHRTVEKLFEEYAEATVSARKGELAKQICTELIIHSQLEELYFYPACREVGVGSDSLDEAQVEHDTARILMAEIKRLPAESAFYDAKVKVLSEYIKHHVVEEEEPKRGVFVNARKAGVDMGALGAILAAHKQELIGTVHSETVSSPRSLDLSASGFNCRHQENAPMAQRSDQERRRDDYGRFAGDDSAGYPRDRDRDDSDRQRPSSAQGWDKYGRPSDHDDDRDRRGSRTYSDRGASTRERGDCGRFSNDDSHSRGRG